MKSAATAVFYSLAMLAAMGAFWFFVFLAPTGVKWLAFIVGIFTFGVWVGRQTMKRE